MLHMLVDLTITTGSRSPRHSTRGKGERREWGAAYDELAGIISDGVVAG